VQDTSVTGLSQAKRRHRVNRPRSGDHPHEIRPCSVRRVRPGRQPMETSQWAYSDRNRLGRHGRLLCILRKEIFHKRDRFETCHGLVRVAGGIFRAVSCASLRFTVSSEGPERCSGERYAGRTRCSVGREFECADNVGAVWDDRRLFRIADFIRPDDAIPAACPFSSMRI
jgi:hypothetical protein